MTRRTLRLTVSALATALIATPIVIASAAPASAHAIVDLSGDPAYAGRTSTMTLEIQHGCLQNEAGVEKVAAYFNKSYVNVVPQPVDEWSSSVKRSGKTMKVVWKLTGEVPAFNTPVFFPMDITWPKKPGVYGLPVRQWCDGATNIWDEPDGPATAGKPSPPLYPLPQVKVLGARKAGEPSGDVVERRPAVKNKIGQGRAVLHIDVDLATVKKVDDRTYRMVLPRDAAGQWMGERTDASGKERVLVGDLTAAQLAKRWSDFRYARDGIGASLIWDTGSRLIRLIRPVETNKGIRFDFRSVKGIPSTLSGVSLNLERAPEAGSRAARYGNQSATYTIVTSDSSTSPATSLMFSWNYNQGGGTAATSGKSRIYNLNTNVTCWSNTTSYSGSKSVVSIPPGSCANVAYSNGSGNNGIELFGPGCTADIAYTPPGQHEYWWQQTLPGC